MATVVVTGATGFLGSHITRELLDRGYRVRGAVRTPAKGAWLGALGAELVAADVTRPETLVEAFAGADAVISNAALATRKRATWAEFAAANRDGTVNVAQAAVDAGVPRLVQISTVAVYQARLGGLNDESTPLLADARVPLSWSLVTTPWRYSLSKSQGEARLWGLAERTGLLTTVLRPGPIYGSRDTKLTERYAAMMKRRVVVAPTTRVPHVHAGDVAVAVAGALSRPASAGRAYNVTGTAVSPLEVLRTWARLVGGGGPRLVPLPVPLTMAFDDSAGRAELGFVCRGIEAGLREVLARRG